jgi:hypothetical protein
MKVYTKIVYDKDDNLIEEHSYNYNGPVAQANVIKATKKAKTFKQKRKEWRHGPGHKGGDIKIIDLSPNITKSLKGEDSKFLNIDGIAKKSVEEQRDEFSPEENTLNKYRAVNTIFTLAALDFTEVNFPETLKIKSPKFVIAKSGGGGNKVANAVHEQQGTVFELFIDEVHVDAIVGPGPKNRHTQATAVNFKVIEPYSMGKFLEVLHLGALMAADDLDGEKNTNHYNSPYALIIDFVPESVLKESDEPLDIEDWRGYVSRDVSGLRKIIPIRITSADFSVNAGGSRYDITAVPWNEAGFDDAVATIPHDVTLIGRTVHEVLSTGENSLMNQLNKREESTSESSDKKRKEWLHGAMLPIFIGSVGGKSKPEGVDDVTDDFMKKRKPNDYVIWFPEDNQLISRGTAPDFKNVDRATWKSDKMNMEMTGQYVTGLTKTATEDKQLQTIFGGRLSLTNSLTEGVRMVNTVAGGEISWYDGNEIGAAKMVTSETFYEALGRTMPDALKKDRSIKFGEVDFEGQTFLYDRKNHLYRRNKITFDPKEKNFTFEAGTKITHIIEQVILLSEYGRKFTSHTVKNGMIDWFRIQPKVLQLYDSAISRSYGFHPKVYAYTIIKYKVMDNLFLSPTELANNVDQLTSMTKKKYDYYYTGKNLDVLDFDLSFKFAFYQPGMPDKGQSPLDQTEVSKSGTKNDGTDLKQSEGGQTLTLAEGKSSLGGSVGEGSGTQDENPFIRLARHYNNVIVNSNVDLVSCDLTIMGDPYWMPNGGLGNYIAAPVKTSDSGTVSSFINGDGDADFTRSQVMCVLNFNSPVDYEMSEQGGQMKFPTVKAKAKGNEKIGQFSGLYRVWQVKNEFVSGMFKQILSMLRINNQPESGKSNKSSERSFVKAKKGKYQEEMENIGKIKDTEGKVKSEERIIEEAEIIAREVKGY